MTISCSKCLFTSENYPQIILNDNGICDVCITNTELIEEIKASQTETHVQSQLQHIRKSKTGKYDCIIGISGGSDSSYMIHLAKEWGLNPLLFHVDGGWNTETTVKNIKTMVEASGFDYECKVLDWSEFKDVQLAFIKSNVLDIDLPFDNILLKTNYDFASKYGIKYIFNGQSTLTEGIMPDSFTHYKLDKRNIRDIYSKFGTLKLKKIRFISTIEFFYFNRIKKIKTLNPLDWINYNKKESTELLIRQYGWINYAGKHYDNLFTRFYQGVILPEKFKVDKRISHLSILICSGQLTKEEAIQQIKMEPGYLTDESKESDTNYFLKKLGLSKIDFEKYLRSKETSHRAFKSDLDFYDFFRPYYRFLKRIFHFKLF